MSQQKQTDKHKAVPCLPRVRLFVNAAFMNEAKNELKLC